MSTLTLSKPKLSIKAQLLATLFAIVGAVALPQLFHVIGALSGLGTLPGETFLPMHLPVMLVGLLAGPLAGALAGVLSPAVSFALSGMPLLTMLPYMMVELCAYGLLAGLLRTVKGPTALKVLCVQLGGRAIRALAILGGIYLFSDTAVSLSSIYRSIPKGLFGILLQLVLLPLICYWVENRQRHER